MPTEVTLLRLMLDAIADYRVRLGELADLCEQLDGDNAALALQINAECLEALSVETKVGFQLRVATRAALALHYTATCGDVLAGQQAASRDMARQAAASRRAS